MLKYWLSYVSVNRDPDGNRIEIIQWLQPYDPAASGAAKRDA